MNILIMCCSAFQIIASTQILFNEFKNDEVDLVITDNIASYETLGERFKASGVYRNVITMKSKGGKWENWRYTFLGWVYDKNIRKAIESIETIKYDVFLCGNIEGVGPCLAEYLRRKNKTKFYFFEDGFVAYSDYYKKCLESAFKRNTIKDKILYFTKRKTIFYIEKYYVFNPKLLQDWDYKFEIVKIPALIKTDDSVKALNKVFEYDKLKDSYKNKYIFFEESYYADGVFVQDKELVNIISKIVGKDNLFIKIHPRNPQNRFKMEGYLTNHDTSIPWELIAINENFEETVLITIASGASITSYFMADSKAKKSIMLYDFESIERDKLTPSLPVFDKLCKNIEYFRFPHNVVELKEELFS